MTAASSTSAPGSSDQEASGEAAARDTSVTDMRGDCRRAAHTGRTSIGSVCGMAPGTLLDLLVPPRALVCAGTAGAGLVAGVGLMLSGALSSDAAAALGGAICSALIVRIAGTGDVLAGMVAARLANGEGSFDAASGAAYEHGAAADAWPVGEALTAAGLASRVA